MVRALCPCCSDIGIVSPLIVMCTTQVFQYLVRQGAALDKWDKFGDTCLHHAARRGQLEMIRVMVSHNAIPWRHESLGAADMGHVKSSHTSPSLSDLASGGAPVIQ
jgi:ankyrin repeat protein